MGNLFGFSTTKKSFNHQKQIMNLDNVLSSDEILVEIYGVDSQLNLP